eukprot:13356-Heterococcus_DN1.PRE.3
MTLLRIGAQCPCKTARYALAACLCSEVVAASPHAQIAVAAAVHLQRLFCIDGAPSGASDHSNNATASNEVDTGKSRWSNVQFEKLQSVTCAPWAI